MWQFFQCAVIGRGHEQREMPCQDKTYKFEYDGVSVIGLADGAGSARLSHDGASRVSEFICKEMAEKFDSYYNNPNGIEVKKYIIDVLRNELQDLAEDLNCSLSDLASTMLFVAVKDEFFIVGHVGDGVIGYIKNNELKVATHPANGEFANTTYFITSSNAIESFQLLKGNTRNGINGFVMFSDGTEASFYDSRSKKLGNALKDIMNLVQITQPQKIEKRIVEFFYQKVRKSTLDDCSISIMVSRQNLEDMNIYQKSEIFSLCPYKVNTPKKIRRYQEILAVLKNPITLGDISRILYLKKRYIKKKLVKLMQANLIEVKDGYYQSILEKHDNLQRF